MGTESFREVVNFLGKVNINIEVSLLFMFLVQFLFCVPLLL